MLTQLGIFLPSNKSLNPKLNIVALSVVIGTGNTLLKILANLVQLKQTKASKKYI